MIKNIFKIYGKYEQDIKGMLKRKRLNNLINCFFKMTIEELEELQNIINNVISFKLK